MLPDLVEQGLGDRQFMHRSGLSRVGMGQHFIEHFPAAARFSLGHGLNGITDMHHYKVSDSGHVILQHEQGHIAPDPLGLAAGGKTVNGFNAHGDGEAHDGLQVSVVGRALRAEREGEQEDGWFRAHDRQVNRLEV
jgi:hypothetical protein